MLFLHDSHVHVKLKSLCLSWSGAAVLSECDSNEPAVIVNDHKALCKESLVCSTERPLSLSLWKVNVIRAGQGAVYDQLSLVSEVINFPSLCVYLCLNLIIWPLYDVSSSQGPRAKLNIQYSWILTDAHCSHMLAVCVCIWVVRILLGTLCVYIYIYTVYIYIYIYIHIHIPWRTMWRLE